MTEKKSDRLSAVESQGFRPESLVGSYFHSDPEGDLGWQGVVVAEPAPGIYLVELFEWLAGTSNAQRLVRIDDMLEWQFYADAQWMRNVSEPILRRQEREAKRAANGGGSS